MRFMMLLPAPADALEKYAVPPAEIVTAMRKYDADMKKAGGLLSEEGLHPSSRGARIRVSGGKRVVTDGPFTEAKELIRRILDHSGQVEGGGHRVGQAVSSAGGWPDRDSAGV